MNEQLKYKITYGYNVTKKEVEVYAFNITEAIQIAGKVMNNEVGLSRITKVEQINEDR